MWSDAYSVRLMLQLASERFDLLFQSPLRRSSDTAKIIWAQRKGAVKTLPSLREVDLYSFQASQLLRSADKTGCSSTERPLCRACSSTRARTGMGSSSGPGRSALPSSSSMATHQSGVCDANS